MSFLNREISFLYDPRDIISSRSSNLLNSPRFPLLDNGTALKGNYSTRRPVELRNLKHTLTSIPKDFGVDRKPAKGRAHTELFHLRSDQDRLIQPSIELCRQLQKLLSEEARAQSREPMSAAKYLVYLTGLSTYALIVWGGYVTLGGYGLGCGTYWPTCNGAIFPALQWPTFVEYVHRLLTVVTGILLLISVIAVWRMKPRPIGPATALALAVVLLIIQSLLGGDVVITELEPVITTVHLAFATAVFASIVLACGLMYTWEKRSSLQHLAKQ